MSKLAKLAQLSIALVAAISLVPEKGHTQAAAAVAPSSQAASQAAAQIASTVASVSASAVQASAAGAAFSKFRSGQALTDLEESLKRHPAFQSTVRAVIQAVAGKSDLSATQAKALAGVLELAASLKNSVAFQVTADQAVPYDKSELDQAISLTQASRGISLTAQELEVVASSFYSLLAGSELVKLILDDKLQEDTLGFRLLESFNSEGVGRSAEEIIANQYAVLAALDGSGSPQNTLEMARGLRSCANFQNVGR